MSVKTQVREGTVAPSMLSTSTKLSSLKTHYIDQATAVSSSDSPTLQKQRIKKRHRESSDGNDSSKKHKSAKGKQKEETLEERAERKRQKKEAKLVNGERYDDGERKLERRRKKEKKARKQEKKRQKQQRREQKQQQQQHLQQQQELQQERPRQKQRLNQHHRHDQEQQRENQLGQPISGIIGASTWRPSRPSQHNPFSTNNAQSWQPSENGSVFDPSQFPPGFDFAAMSNFLNGAPPQRAQALSPAVSGIPSTSQKTTQISTDTDLLAAAVQSHASSSSYRPPPPSSSSPPRRPVTPRSTVARNSRSEIDLAKSKEATLQDAAPLTFDEMLVDRLYHPHQLRWLAQARGLTWRTGRFSKTETDAIFTALHQFRMQRGMSETDLDNLINARTGDQRDDYYELFRMATAAVGGRPNRVVRKHIKESFHPDTCKGRWTDAQVHELSIAVQELGMKWKEVAMRVGRSPRDCKVRWKDHNDELAQQRKRGPWNEEEVESLRRAVEETCNEVNIRPENKGIPWGVVSRKMGGTRSSNTCYKKWEWLVAADKRISASASQEPEEEQNPTQERLKWVKPRDEKILIERVFETQQHAIDANDETMIDWKNISMGDWVWPRDRLYERYLHLKKNRIPEGWEGTLAQQLTAAKAVIDERFSIWKDAGEPENFAGSPSTKRRKLKSMKNLSDLIDSEEEADDLSASENT